MLMQMADVPVYSIVVRPVILQSVTTATCCVQEGPIADHDGRNAERCSGRDDVDP
jgi:hypothetical protein